MKKFIVLSIDGLGIGQLPDVPSTRREDIGANTLKHTLNKYPFTGIPVLKSLGLEYSFDLERKHEHRQGNFLYTVAKSKYSGVDNFFAHQEILGAKPRKVAAHPFSTCMDEIAKLLLANNLKVLRYNPQNDQKEGVLIVNNSLIIGDEIDFDVGSGIKLTGILDLMPFNVMLEIGKLIRNNVKNAYVSVSGTRDIDFKILFKGYQIKEGKYAGISVPLSRVYNEHYKLLYLGNQVNYKGQLPYKLSQVGVKTTLIGNSSDNGDNESFIESYDSINMDNIYEHIEEAAKKQDNRFIFANIYDLTLPGRSKDTKLFSHTLEKIDTFVEKVMSLISSDGVLVVMGSHGADPLVEFLKYTREYVPILIYSKNMTYGSFKARESLADVSATVAEYFNAKNTELGDSFYSLMF